MQFRIGDRDPVTGLYDVIWPDGSTTRNGLKVFNAAHQIGDVVQVTRRSDGMMILDSAKAVTTDNLTRSIANPDLVSPPPSYLQGQVFNREQEEPDYDLITIKTHVVKPTNMFDNTGEGVDIYTFAYYTSTARTSIRATYATTNSRPKLDADLLKVDTAASLAVKNIFQSNDYYYQTIETVAGVLSFDNSYLHVNKKALRELAQLGHKYVVFADCASVLSNGTRPSLGTVSVQTSKTVYDRQTDPNNFRLQDRATLGGNDPYSSIAIKKKGYIDLKWTHRTQAFVGSIYTVVWGIQIDTSNPKNIVFLEPEVVPAARFSLAQQFPQTIL